MTSHSTWPPSHCVQRFHKAILSCLVCSAVSGPILCPECFGSLEMSNTSSALWDTLHHEDEGLRMATQALIEEAPEASWLLCTQWHRLEVPSVTLGSQSLRGYSICLDLRLASLQSGEPLPGVRSTSPLDLKANTSQVPSLSPLIAAIFSFAVWSSLRKSCSYTVTNSYRQIISKPLPSSL